jgi:hypothetical protein
MLVAMALLGTGCSSGDADTTDAAQSGGSSENTVGQEADAQAALTADFETWLETNYGSEAWYPKVNGLAYPERLRKPAVVVYTDLNASDMSAVMNDVANEWANSEQGSELLVRWVSNDGMIIQGGMPLSVLLADSVPAPATGADDFMRWLDAAYGPGSGDPVDEEWYARVQSAGPSADGATVEVVTDLDFEKMTDREQADVIGQVLILAAPAGTSGWTVRFADGNNIVTSS